MQKKFECVRCSINGTSIPMLSVDDDLFVTNSVLRKALGVSDAVLRDIHSRRKSEFDENCVFNTDAISYLKENKDLFGTIFTC